MIMSEFDRAKAQREIVSGVEMSRKAFANHARRAEQRLAEAEAEHNAAQLMLSSVNMLLEFETTRLRALEDEAERK